MPKVFVPRELMLNQEEAMKWGDVKILSKKDDPNFGLEPDRIVMQIAKHLTRFNQKDDFLLLDGHIVYNSIAAAVLSSWHDDFKILVWKGAYALRQFKIPKIDRREAGNELGPVIWAVNQAHNLEDQFETMIRYVIDRSVNIDRYDPDPIWKEVLKKCQDFGPNDKIVLCGSALMNIVTVVYLMRRIGEFTIVLKDHKTNRHVPRSIYLTRDHLDRICK